MPKRLKCWRILSLVLSILLLLISVVAIVLPLILTVVQDTNPLGGMTNVLTLAGDTSTGNTLLGLKDNQVVAVDPKGNILWKAGMSSAVTSIAADGGYIVAAAQDKSVVVLNADGSEAARFECYYTPNFVAVCKEQNIIAVSAGMSALKNNIQTFDLQGNELDTQKISTTCVGLVIDPDTAEVYYLTQNSRLYKLGAEKDGYAQTEYEPRGISYDSTTQQFYMVDTQGTVYSIGKDFNVAWSVNLEEEALNIAFDGPTQTVCVLLKNNTLSILQDAGRKNYVLDAPLEAELLTATGGSRFVAASKDGKYSLVDMASVGMQNILQSSQKLAILMLPIAIILLLLAITYQSDEKWADWKEKVKQFFRVLNKHKISYLFLLPTFVLLIIFNYFPAVWAFVLAFTDYLPGVYCKFVGFDNFIGIFQNEYFWTGIGNMLVFLVTDLLKALIPPLLVAEFLLALRSQRKQYWARVLMYIPGILPGLAGLLIWVTGILGMDGIINAFLELFGMESLIHDWLGDERTALGALCFIGFPWVGSYIIMYGALRGVPSSLYEAAKLDGCGWWRRIISIDIPLISPQLKYIFVTSFIGSIQDFNRVYQTTMGGPGKATYIPALELYYNITIFKDYGAASAMGILLFIVIFGATLALLRMQTQDEMV